MGLLGAGIGQIMALTAGEITVQEIEYSGSTLTLRTVKPVALTAIVTVGRGNRNHGVFEYRFTIARKLIPQDQSKAIIGIFNSMFGSRLTIPFENTSCTGPLKSMAQVLGR